MATRRTQQIEQIIPFHDGSLHNVLVTKYPVFSDAGVIIGIGAINHDVTDLRIIEKQLRESHKMDAIGRLAGGVAHDFNNMLQVIQGFTKLLADDASLSAAARTHLGQVKFAAERATTLTQQLLTFSRKEVLMRRRIDISDMIDTQMKMLQRIIGEDIELQVSFAGNLPQIHGDQPMLEQVVMNMCINARDAMPKGGRITIEVESLRANKEYCMIHPWARVGEYVVLSITDSGEGITRDNLDHIFEPFFTTKEVGRGTGLGLSMAYGIIQQHNGTISVYSEPGLGARFSIYLPGVGNADVTAEEPPEVEAPGGSETILVAEDEEMVRDLITIILEQKGYRVIVAKDGEEALEQFRKHQDSIDMVILDVVMPKLGGRAVYDEIIAVHPKLPVLFSTGYAANTLSPEFLESNKLIVIQKPFVPDVLLAAVRTVIDGHSPS